MKKILFSILAFFLFFFFAPWVFQAKADHFAPLPTEFSYSEEKLSKIRSPHLITIERIDKWEAALQNYFIKNNTGYSIQLRFYTYLYLAQRDAVFLSYNIHRCFAGSLDPLTKKVVAAFFPDFDGVPEDFYSDPYSDELAKQIWPYYFDRLEKENASSRRFKPCLDEDVPEYIQSIAKWIPWAGPLPTAPPPGREIENVRTKPLTDEQIHLMHAWAGEKGLVRHWRILANEFMLKEQVPVGKTLFVRSILMMGLYDSQIAVLNAKYAYCVPRPSNPRIKKSATPGYPSGHASQAGTAEVILSYFFPEESTKWRQIAEEASQSRVWARVHTDQDVEAGLELGKQVGEAALNTFRETPACLIEPLPRQCPFSRR